MQFHQAIYQLLSLLVGIGVILFLARILVAPFSEKVFSQMRRHPVAHLVWGLFCVCGFCFLYILVFNGPPDWWDRRQQRKVVYERVQAAGGWNAIRRDCELLASNKTEPFYWHPAWPHAQVTWLSNGTSMQYTTNIDYGPLPPAVAALHPREITYYPPQSLRQFKDRSDVPVICIRLFGIHSTGGHSQPYFGLQVVCGTNSPDYKPKSGPSGGVDGNSHSTYRKVADGVFEIY
jgi:hypothetical protein